MTQMIDVTLPGPAPWGFRLAGGKDFNTPIHISKTTPNGKAGYAGLQIRDVVASINGTITSSLTHFDAQDVIKNVYGDLHLRIRRGGAWVQSPTQSNVQYDFPSAPPPIRRMEPEMVVPPPGPTATVVHKQFNSPVGLYSADNIADAFKGQVEGMSIDTGGVKYSPGASQPSTPFGSSYEVLHSKPKMAPMAQTYAPPARAGPARPLPPRQAPPMRSGQGFSNPGARSRSFKMVEDMTHEEESRGYQANPASNYRSPIDEFESFDNRSRGTQSRSFRMLQQLTAEEEAMMDE